MRETIRLSDSQFKTSGPIVEYDIETWRCGCREWPIVVSSTTYSTKDQDAWPVREAWFVRSCRLCKMEPRP